MTLNKQSLDTIIDKEKTKIRLKYRQKILKNRINKNKKIKIIN